MERAKSTLLSTRTFLLPASLILILFATTAQAQDWQWGKRAQNYTAGVTTDNHGNSYAIWAIGDQANVDGHVIPSHGYTDIGITSFTCDGTYRWTKTTGTVSPDAASAIGADSLGGIYVVGSIGSSNAAPIYIDTVDTLNPTWMKMIILKYDTTGTLQWWRMPEAPSLSGSNLTGAFQLTVEPDGTLHVFCRLEAGTYANGAFDATYPPDQDIYSLQYDKDGNFLNGVHLDVTRPTNYGIIPYGTGLIYDPITTRYYWLGRRYDPYTITFGSTPVTGMNFLACFDSNGNSLWTQKSNDDSFYTWFHGTPAIDDEGNIYGVGASHYNYNGPPDWDGFGGTSFENEMGVWSFPFLVKFDASGNVLYHTNASGTADNSAADVVWYNGKLAVAGQYASGAFDWDGTSLEQTDQYYNEFIAQFDPVTGSVLRIDTLTSSPFVEEHVKSIKADSKGNLFLAGEFYQDIIIAGQTFVKQDGNTDGYLAKLGSSDCSCNLPVVTFNTQSNGPEYTFTFTGSPGTDSVLWNFGNGVLQNGNTVTYQYPATGSFTVCATAYNSCGSAETCQTIMVANAGTAALSATQILVSPNPVEAFLYVDCPAQQVQYSLYTASGALLEADVLTADRRIFMGNLAKGYYLLHITTPDGTVSTFRVVR